MGAYDQQTELNQQLICDDRFNRSFICFQRISRYIRAAFLLHLVSCLSAGMLLYCMKAVCSAPFPGVSLSEWCYTGGGLYCMGLIFFSQMDAKSRFQDYKLAKDLLFENGFEKRIINLFCGSRCQREAVLTAAMDLGMDDRLKAHYKDLGFRWFHIIPEKFFSSPGIVFTRRFWQKTLFSASYESRYFLW